MKKVLTFPVLFLILSVSTYGQDTLPKFSVTNFGPKRNLVNWVNNYPTVKQISIQRSSDSIRNFTTILTVPDANSKENGYMDTKSAADNMFYRLFIITEGSNFLFTASKRPFFDTANKVVAVENNPVLVTAIPDKNADSITIMILDTLTDQYVAKRIKNDKVSKLTDSVAAITMSTGLKNNQKPVVFVPSLRIFTNSDGYLRISLDDYDKRKYSVKFYEDDERFLFELKEVKSSYLVLDKANFYHSGWFRFELFDNGKLIEKHKFFIPKDLR